MPDPLDIFAANLRRLRRERNLSQERLAHSSDLNVTHVAKIERSEREPGVRTISKLARALKVSASELFDGIDGHETGRIDVEPALSVHKGDPPARRTGAG
jgi:transcriptional regulator with XRE-family HTH domain